MLNYTPNEQWSTYEAMVQAYESNFFSSQSILLAVGAITLDKSVILTLVLAVCALIQIWYIWFRPIYIRYQISDYHKYGMDKLFDADGEFFAEGADQTNALSEYKYVSDKAVRTRVHENLTSAWSRPQKFRTLRLTRIKFDVMMPAFMSAIWVAFAVYAIINR